MDNGVYHDFGKDEEKEGEEKKDQGKKGPEPDGPVKQTELEKLENMIRQEESVNNLTNMSDEQPFECAEEEGIPDTNQLEPGSGGAKAQLAEHNQSVSRKQLAQTNTLTIGKCFNWFEVHLLVCRYEHCGIDWRIWVQVRCSDQISEQQRVKQRNNLLLLAVPARHPRGVPQTGAAQSERFCRQPKPQALTKTVKPFLITT